MKKGRVLHSSLFLLRIAMADDPAVLSRISAAVSQKIAPKASARVKIRRFIYNAVSSLLPEMKTGSLVIIFAKSLKEIVLPLATEDLRQTFVKAGLMK